MDPDQLARAFVEPYYTTFDANRGGLASLYQEEFMLTFEGQKVHVCSAGFYERKSDSFDYLWLRLRDLKLLRRSNPLHDDLWWFHLYGFREGYPLAKPPGRCYAIRSNQGESSGSGGRAGEERNGGGRDGNQGIGGGVGGGGQREGIGNERRGNRGRNHGGGNGDDDGNDRGGWVGYIEGERRPMGPRPHRMAEILLLLDAEIIGTLESLDIRGLSARARILRVFSLGFTSVSLVCLSASIGQRRTNPILASIFSWIGSATTFLGFFLMIAMAFSASFIP